MPSGQRHLTVNLVQINPGGGHMSYVTYTWHPPEKQKKQTGPHLSRLHVGSTQQRKKISPYLSPPSLTAQIITQLASVSASSTQ